MLLFYLTRFTPYSFILGSHAALELADLALQLFDAFPEGGELLVFGLVGEVLEAEDLGEGAEGLRIVLDLLLECHIFLAHYLNITNQTHLGSLIWGCGWG